MKCNDLIGMMMSILFSFTSTTYLRIPDDGDLVYPDNQLGLYPNSDEKYQKVSWLN